MMNADFNFLTYLLNDEIVSDYLKHRQKIHSEIIRTDPSATNSPQQSPCGNLGAFPLLVHTGNGYIDLIHHVTPGTTNILTD